MNLIIPINQNKRHRDAPLFVTANTKENPLKTRCLTFLYVLTPPHSFTMNTSPAIPNDGEAIFLYHPYRTTHATPISQDDIEAPNGNDDETATIALDIATVHRKVSFASHVTEYDPPTIPVIHSYIAPKRGYPTPYFVIGRYRFPDPIRRFLPQQYSTSRYQLQHPGDFQRDYFIDAIWPSNPVIIVDPHISQIEPETMYIGIGYQIEVLPSAWDDRIVKRGTTLIFRNFISPSTQYIATWTLEHHIEYAYVQFSAFRKDQDTHYNDPDWPTLRTKVPANLCSVPYRSLPRPIEPQVPTSPPKLPWWRSFFKRILPPPNAAAGDFFV